MQDEMPSSPPDMKPRASRQVLQSFEVYRDEASKPRKPASKIAQELYAVSQERESLLTRLQALNSWEARLLNQLAKEGDAHQG